MLQVNTEVVVHVVCVDLLSKQDNFIAFQILSSTIKFC